MSDSTKRIEEAFLKAELLQLSIENLRAFRDFLVELLEKQKEEERRIDGD